jgi:hypothetical protein
VVVPRFPVKYDEELLKLNPSELAVRLLKIVKFPSFPAAVLVNVDPETFVASVITTSTTTVSVSTAEEGLVKSEKIKVAIKILKPYFINLFCPNQNWFSDKINDSALSSALNESVTIIYYLMT